MASDDAFDPGTFVLAGLFAGKGMLLNSSPSFGQGVKGYAHYYVTSFSDFVVGDYMTEAIYPSLLHEDPRYYRLGTGGGFRRLGHAVGQIFRTRTDSGGHTFNFSEFVGNATAVAIATSYYPDNRDAASAASQCGVQIAIDMAGNILKEFAPDVMDKIRRKKNR